MRSVLKVVALSVLGLASSAQAAVTYTVDPGATWVGWMNVFELPSNGGAYLWGSSWGVADLAASFSGSTLTLAPNSINDPASYWYTPAGGPGSTGNKIMNANLYQEFNGTLAGENITFTGEVVSNTFGGEHSSIAFIKDFAPDYSSSVNTTVPLTGGIFSISLAAINDPARHVQFGFATTGPDVWITDVAAYGSLQVTAVPEPSIIGFGLASGALLVLRRRRA